jgi:hypothetical protein
MTAGVLGVDIGGANLKAAHSSGLTRTQAFALWKNPAGLSAALADMLVGWPEYRTLAVTMTGELCDCFSSRRVGVQAILDAVEALQFRGAVQVWCNDGWFRSIAEARKLPLQVASANWLALATYAGQFAPQGSALLIDVGSTTTDNIPLVDGKPVPKGRTDVERFSCGELVYLGARRTPLNVLLGTQGAAEFFATMQDVLLVLGVTEEDASDCDTADGRPATVAAAHSRLARMICADVETSTLEERTALAADMLERWTRAAAAQLTKVSSLMREAPLTVILAGSGELLARKAVQLAQSHPKVISVANLLGPAISTAACAYAVAAIAAETTAFRAE